MDMVDRVARAWHDYEPNSRNEGWNRPYSLLPPGKRAVLRANARAAIEVMLAAGPDRAGRIAVWNHMEGNARAGNMRPGQIAGNGAPDVYWRLMVEAVLRQDQSA